jgi:hypothetical protein
MSRMSSTQKKVSSLNINNDSTIYCDGTVGNQKSIEQLTFEAESKSWAKSVEKLGGKPNIGCSGTGSENDIINKQYYIPFLKHFINNNNIKSVVDLGCGTFNLGESIYNDLNVHYTGYDVQKDVVKSNRKNFSRYENSDIKSYNFEYINLYNKKCIDNMFKADLCVIKDVLQHWSTEKVMEFLNSLLSKKKFNHILIINCYTDNWKDGPFIGERIVLNEIRGNFDYLSFNNKPFNKFKQNFEINNTKYKGKILGTYITKEVFLISLEEIEAINFKYFTNKSRTSIYRSSMAGGKKNMLNKRFSIKTNTKNIKKTKKQKNKKTKNPNQLKQNHKLFIVFIFVYIFIYFYYFSNLKK